MRSNMPARRLPRSLREGERERETARTERTETAAPPKAETERGTVRRGEGERVSTQRAEPPKPQPQPQPAPAKAPPPKPQPTPETKPPV